LLIDINLRLTIELLCTERKPTLSRMHSNTPTPNYPTISCSFLQLIHTKSQIVIIWGPFPDPLMAFSTCKVGGGGIPNDSTILENLRGFSAFFVSFAFLLAEVTRFSCRMNYSLLGHLPSPPPLGTQVQVEPGRRRGSTGVMTRPEMWDFNDDGRLFTFSNIPAAAAAAGSARSLQLISPCPACQGRWYTNHLAQ
jgi:hypothetical protein